MDRKLKNAFEDYLLVREKTYEFLKTLPQEKMTWKPHKLLGTFGMQLRHMSKSQHAYIKGITTGRLDFEDKQAPLGIEKDKEKAIKHLKKLDKELARALEKLKHDTKILFVDGVHGTFKVSIATALSYLADHEFYHQGIFTCYGRLAGLGKFTFM